MTAQLQPLGGEESTGGYKGYRLGLAVNLLTGALAGAALGPSVVPLFSTHDGPSDLGHLFLVIDPATVDDGFKQRLKGYLDRLTRAPLILEAKGRLGGPFPTEGNPAV